MTCFKGQFLLTATVVTPLLFAATGATAQTAKRFVVKGVVADAATKEGEQYATMKITSQTDSTSTAALAVSEADGSFSMTLKKAGSYRLFVNAMGKQPIVRNFVVSDSEPVAALDTLYKGGFARAGCRGDSGAEAARESRHRQNYVRHRGGPRFEDQQHTGDVAQGADGDGRRRWQYQGERQLGF